MCMPPKKDYASYWNTSIDQRIISPVHAVAPSWLLDAVYFAILFVIGIGLVTMHRLGVFGMI